MQVESPILKLFLLLLKISLYLGLDISHKNSRFSKILLKKSFEFVSSRRNGIVAFNLGFIVLPVEVDPILEKYSYKRDTLGARGTNHMKIVLALLIKVVVLNIWTTIIQFGIPGLGDFILGCGVCFLIFLDLNKKF